MSELASRLCSAVTIALAAGLTGRDAVCAVSATIGGDLVVVTEQHGWSLQRENAPRKSKQTTSNVRAGKAPFLMNLPVGSARLLMCAEAELLPLVFILFVCDCQLVSPIEL